MTHGSLFTGIGGIDLGFEWAGIETKWQVEIDDYCRELLDLRFPHTKKFKDVKEVGKHNLEQVDIISGGFPCQDISVAGKGAGIEGERSGLWSELHRVISELRPRFAFIENVPILTIRGGTRVIADLAEIGYDAEWQIISAADVGAWHLRKRIWIVAYPKVSDTARRTDGQHPRNMGSSDAETYSTRQAAFRNSISSRSPKTRADVPNANTGFSNRENNKIQTRRYTFNIGIQDVPDTKSKRQPSFKNRSAVVRPQERSKLLCGSGNADGIQSNWKYWSVEPNVGRVANGIPKRVDRLKGIGNAVVPQIPYIIGKRLMEL